MKLYEMVAVEMAAMQTRVARGQAAVAAASMINALVALEAIDGPGHPSKQTLDAMNLAAAARFAHDAMVRADELAQCAAELAGAIGRSMVPPEAE